MIDKIKESFPGDREILKEGIKVARRDFRINRMGQIVPLKPTVLNLLVNDVCNSKCQMCAVWKQKKDHEISVGELELILKDPLFEALEYIGVSGGEPTLRDDLTDIFKLIARHVLPRRGTGIITNAIKADQVIERVEKSVDLCRKQGIRFNMMVSLDGVGEIHDKIRGHKGNYESAVEVIRHFKKYTHVPVSVGCTITKDNVWHVDEVFDFCKQEGISGLFRIAEFIDRLYNQNETQIIRNFSEQERYHLGLFFLKLERSLRKDAQRRRTYRNIRKMLMEDAGRRIKCHWQTTAVTLDCRGQLLYCAPHSPILGNCLNISPGHLYKKNINRRRLILKSYCQNCIHDYGSTETFQEWLEEEKVKYWRKRFSNERLASKSINTPPSKKVRTINQVRPASKFRKFMIIGWYGTATAGDKAILAEIVSGLRRRYPGCRIILASIHPYYSTWTIRELLLKDIKIIQTFSSECWRQIKKVDEVVMGGGPLMHIRALGSVLAIFSRAKQLGKSTRIAGCGIGPLDQDEKFETIVQKILELADVIELRDQESVEWAKQRTGRSDIVLSGDYAAGFVRHWMEQPDAPQVPRSKPFLNLYLREWTEEYRGTLASAQFHDLKQRFEKMLGKTICSIGTSQNLTVRLLPMHHFCIGNDDRDFNRNFARIHLKELDPFVEKRPVSIQEILKSMQEGALSICMRFHSVLFADTLGIPFVAIDYTHGGKIAGFLKDRQKLDQMYTLKEIAEGRQISIPRISPQI